MEADIMLHGAYYILFIFGYLVFDWFQMDRRAKRGAVRALTRVFFWGFSAFMVLGRLTARVHWAMDIIGSVLLSGGLFLLYLSTVRFSDCRRNDIEKTL